MAYQGRGRVPGSGPEAEAADIADIQEQWRPAVEDDQEDPPPRWDLPAEASEADAVEQLTSAPLDDDDRR